MVCPTPLSTSRVMRFLASFSNAKAGKDAAKKILSVNRAGNSAKAVSRPPVVFSRDFRCCSELMAQDRLKCHNRLLQGSAVPVYRRLRGNRFTISTELRSEHPPTNVVPLLCNALDPPSRPYSVDAVFAVNGNKEFRLSKS